MGDRTDFAAHYEGVPDEGLAALETDIESLLPAAQEALLAEIARRNLDVVGIQLEGDEAKARLKRSKQGALKKTLYFTFGMAIAIFVLGAFQISLGAIPYVAVIAVCGLASQILLLRIFK